MVVGNVPRCALQQLIFKSSTKKMCTFPAKKNAACAQRLYCASAEAYVACTQTMFYFSFLSFGKHRRSRAQGEHPYPFELAVNKSPSVYFLSRALDGQRVCEQLKHTQRGSVKRYELGRGHFYLFIYYFIAVQFPSLPGQTLHINGLNRSWTPTYLSPGVQYSTVGYSQ